MNFSNATKLIRPKITPAPLYRGAAYTIAYSGSIAVEPKADAQIQRVSVRIRGIVVSIRIVPTGAVTIIASSVVWVAIAQAVIA